MILKDSHVGHFAAQGQDFSARILPGVPLLKRRPHKDIYDLGDKLLIVANDALLNPYTLEIEVVEGKGEIATKQSAFWFRQLSGICPTHLLRTNIDDLLGANIPDAEYFSERSTLVTKIIPLPFQCRVQGYLTDSAWNEYLETGSLAGFQLPEGLTEAQRLPAPVFIPVFKKPVSDGDVIELKKLCGQHLSDQIRNTALDLYFKAWKIARRQNVLLVSCFFRFGLYEDKLHLIGECITPDSSLFAVPGLGKYRPTLAKAGKSLLFSYKEGCKDDGMASCHGEKRTTLECLQFLFSKLSGCDLKTSLQLIKNITED